MKRALAVFPIAAFLLLASSADRQASANQLTKLGKRIEGAIAASPSEHVWGKLSSKAEEDARNIVSDAMETLRTNAKNLTHSDKVVLGKWLASALSHPLFTFKVLTDGLVLQFRPENRHSPGVFGAPITITLSRGVLKPSRKTREPYLAIVKRIAGGGGSRSRVLAADGSLKRAD